MTNDLTFMDLALRLGQRNRGATAENPSVGCVIVSRDGHIVGRGWTAEGGRPHAETAALTRAGAAARGGTSYVTLEPCSHTGKTGPCADALIGAGVTRVVTAIEDPDPRVAGQGHQRLRDAGIRVDVGVRQEQARQSLAGFLSRIERGRPFVTLKLAVSRDGKIAGAGGSTVAITGPAALARSHLMRARTDAILVGRTTVSNDNPSLTCRLPGLEHRSPIRVVLDSALATSAEAQLVASAHERSTLIYCGEDANPECIERLRDVGADIVSGISGEPGRLVLGDVLEDLSQRGINDLLVEGGAQIAASFLNAGLVDRVALFRAPIGIGGDGVDALSGLPLDAITRGERFVPTGTECHGQDVLDWYARKE